MDLSLRLPQWRSLVTAAASYSNQICDHQLSWQDFLLILSTWFFRQFLPSIWPFLPLLLIYKLTLATAAWLWGDSRRSWLRGRSPTHSRRRIGRWRAAHHRLEPKAWGREHSASIHCHLGLHTSSLSASHSLAETGNNLDCYLWLWYLPSVFQFSTYLWQTSHCRKCSARGKASTERYLAGRGYSLEEWRTLRDLPWRWPLRSIDQPLE